MIVPSGRVQVFVATRPVDFRKGMDGLAALVERDLGLDPFSGAIYEHFQQKWEPVLRSKMRINNNLERVPRFRFS